jgi:acyl carrier protein
MIKHIFQTMLGLRHGDAVDGDQQLMDAGLNSMMAVQFRATIQKEVSMNLPATLLFDCPTVSALMALMDSSTEQEEDTSTHDLTSHTTAAVPVPAAS